MEYQATLAMEILALCLEEIPMTQQDGKDIKGLYAGGRTAIGICCNIYVSGLSIADGIFSGRRAGLNISGE